MAYEEEYYGLNNKEKTWTYKSEEEYQQLNPDVGNHLPTIYLTTFNTDSNGKSQRAKYRIFVLGNLGPTNWSRNEVFYPVLSQLELRLLITIAVQKICKLNTG